MKPRIFSVAILPLLLLSFSTWTGCYTQLAVDFDLKDFALSGNTVCAPPTEIIWVGPPPCNPPPDWNPWISGSSTPPGEGGTGPSVTRESGYRRSSDAATETQRGESGNGTRTGGTQRDRR